MSPRSSLIKRVLVSQHQSIKETMRVIDRAGIGIAFVVDQRQRLRGAASDGDIRRAILRGVTIAEPIGSIMTKKPISIPFSWDVQDIRSFLRGETITKRGPFEQIKIPMLDANRKVVDILFVKGVDFFSLEKFKKKAQHPLRQVKRVLVLGGAGYIGSVLVRKLLGAGYQIAILDAFLYGEESLASLKNHRRLRIIRGDIRHIEDVTEAASTSDAVIHLAELVGDPAAELNPRITQEVNYLATKQIASICKHYQVNRFIYFSSCSVYGTSNREEPLDEGSPLHPLSLYARTKLESEKALTEMTDDNFAPTILRLATVYGKSYRPRFDLIVNHLAAKAVVEREIPVFGGQQWRPNIHVDDVSRAMLLLLQAPTDRLAGEIFNVGVQAQNYRVSEIAQIIRRCVPSAKISRYTGKADQRSYKVNFSKFTSAFRFHPKRKIEDGVREIQMLLTSGEIQNYQEKRYSNVKYLRDHLSI